MPNERAVVEWAIDKLEKLLKDWERRSPKYRRSTMKAVHYALDPRTNPKLGGEEEVTHERRV